MRKVDREKLDCEGYPTESRQEMKKRVWMGSDGEASAEVGING